MYGCSPCDTGKKTDFRTLSITQNGSTASRFIRWLYSRSFLCFFLSAPYRIGKDRMDFRSRRRCGNVRKLPVPAALWETCLQDVGKACPFPCAVNGFSIGASGSFPHFHDAYFYPALSRYMVNGTYRTATISRQTRMKPPITPPMIQFSANSAIPPPKEPPPGTIQRHIRWRPKGNPQSIQSHT